MNDSAAKVEKIVALLVEKFAAKRDEEAKWDACIVLSREYLHDAVDYLKNACDVKFDMLLDVAGIDYQTYEGHEGFRFAVSYAFKSMANPGCRLRLKVNLSEADLKVQSITDLYASADWLEREAYDQYGIQFVGHPDLRRLLNHVEFVGHPLRKDYPAHKRQWLSTSDFLIPELEKRLESKGYRVIERSENIDPVDDEFLEGSRK